MIKLGHVRAQVARRYGCNEDTSGCYIFLDHVTTTTEYLWKEMSSDLKGIELLQTRNKIAVVPIVRKALSVLFGTVSEDV